MEKGSVFSRQHAKKILVEPPMHMDVNVDLQLYKRTLKPGHEGQLGFQRPTAPGGT